MGVEALFSEFGVSGMGFSCSWRSNRKFAGVFPVFNWLSGYDKLHLSSDSAQPVRREWANFPLGFGGINILCSEPGLADGCSILTESLSKSATSDFVSRMLLDAADCPDLLRREMGWSKSLVVVGLLAEGEGFLIGSILDGSIMIVPEDENIAFLKAKGRGYGLAVSLVEGLREIASSPLRYVAANWGADKDLYPEKVVASLY